MSHEIIHKKKVIDTPILFDEESDRLNIFNAGSMNQWVIGYYDGEEEFLKKGIYKDIKTNHNVISLNDFVSTFLLEPYTWSMHCTGFFDDYMIKAIKTIPTSGTFIQVYKLMDMLLRRVAIKNKIDIVYYDRKKEELVYKIISSTNPSKGGIICFTKEIDGGFV